ncbi:MAG: family 43 glycosylhydrolase [Planctomycetes bacterium]|nr:family 43 glycosylhydrolase [Planctomycetota bacterium]
MKTVLHTMALILASQPALQSAEDCATYVNPVGGELRMGDPFVLLHDGKYYLYGTNAGDGFTYWTSSNLRDWEAGGYAYRRRGDSWGGKTFWAPEVHPYRGTFYMVYSAQPRDAKTFAARICLAVADDPAGPFTDFHAPLFDVGWSCIDGHLFLDDDGKPYLFFDRVGARGDAHSPSGSGYLYGDIYGVELEKDLSGPMGEPTLCLQADQPWELSTTPGHARTRTNEGAFVFKRGAVYYLTYSSHHYADPLYGIGYATANSPLGPWTKSAENPLVAKDLSIGVSGPGHSSITTSPDGKELFLIYHAHADVNRPSGNRTVNIDRLLIDGPGHLEVHGPTRSPQPLPSGAGGGAPPTNDSAPSGQKTGSESTDPSPRDPNPDPRLDPDAGGANGADSPLLGCLRPRCLPGRENGLPVQSFIAAPSVW